MTDLQEILHSVEKLSLDDLETLRQRIEERQRRLQTSEIQDAQARVAALHEALEAFREGLSEADLQEIVRAMNVEYVNPEELKRFDWLDELPEDER
ncbi:MAG: hypothetical protein L0154_08720 [Chloroflexi bacterium]|nr:hypothetical protein [Chloroflexota bacterium]